ncbi:MAG: hypothetical protein AVDCRST_MAG02-2625, partial [uncultured Rubrobacteraceae bacterium]
ALHDKPSGASCCDPALHPPPRRLLRPLRRQPRREGRRGHNGGERGDLRAQQALRRGARHLREREGRDRGRQRSLRPTGQRNGGQGDDGGGPLQAARGKRLTGRGERPRRGPGRQALRGPPLRRHGGPDLGRKQGDRVLRPPPGRPGSREQPPASPRPPRTGGQRLREGRASLRRSQEPGRREPGSHRVLAV